MAIDQFSPTDLSIRPATLEFGVRQLELEYHHYSFRSLTRQARVALILGLSLWLFYGLLDYLFVPSSHVDAVWNIRTIVICAVILVFVATFHSIFEHFNQQILTAVALVNAAGLLVKMWLLPEIAISHYFPGLILIIFWSHNFSGMRFIFASFTSMAIFIAFNLLFIVFDPIPIAELVSTNFYILASIALAACASYLSERQNRILFLHERELDNERKHQLSRALHDSLTGLPNRELLDDRLEQAISQASRDERPCAGLFIDLDGFKSINDTYGHDVGDLFLKEVATRFKNIMREADTLSRIGGDEFFVLARDIQTTDAAKILADKLLNQLQAPFKLDDEIIVPSITASIGICIFPYKHCTPVDVVRRADQAMYEIKRGIKAGVAFAGSYEASDSPA
jgi:diguanylate cyclase (GGDEF)-like protein